MSLVKTTYPGIIIRNVLDEVRRFAKHSSQNFALLNDSMALISFTASHGVEVPIKNPFGDRGAPVGFKVLDSTGTLGVASHTMRIARLTEDNRIGMTVQFDGKHTEPCLIKTLSADKSINSGGLTTVDTWNTDANAETNRGGVISESAGTFTVSEAGLYHVSFMAALENVAYTQAQVRIDATGNPQFLNNLPAAFSSAPFISVHGQFELAAGGTFTCRAQQTNGGGLARLVLSGAANTRVVVSRSYNSTVDGYTATVTGILYGPNANITDVNG